MRKFFTSILGYFIALSFLTFSLLSLSFYHSKTKRFSNSTTEGNTTWLGSNQNYDYLFLGISHARNFSRGANHDTIQKYLNGSVCNLAQGSGICGIREQLFYLNLFIQNNNKANQIIYVLSPPLMFSNKLPAATNTFKFENFNTTQLISYLNFNSEKKLQRFISYFQYKLNPWWFLYKPSENVPNNVLLNGIDYEVIEDGFRSAYGAALDYQRFKKNKEIIQETINVAIENDIEIIFIIPPAVFGKWPGHSDVKQFCHELSYRRDNVSYFDYAEAMLDKEFYYDHHHLNSNGVREFITTFLQSDLSTKNTNVDFPENEESPLKSNG